MSASNGLIYEVTLTIERDIVEPFDRWLAEHVDDMLAISGFDSARVFAIEDDDEGYARRVTHYYLESEDHLQQYLSGQAAEMRQSAINRFGDHFSAIRRILRQTALGDEPPDAIEHCLNCSVALDGQYCGNCGQRARSRLISLWELITDAFGDLFELDSRIWRTLGPLLLRPGKLTFDYLQGRRARFMPPFRTYLVLSVVFFALYLFNPKDEFGLLFEPEPESTEDPVESKGTAEEIRDKAFAELAEQGIIIPADDLDLAEASAESPEVNSSSDSDGDPAIDDSIVDSNDDCDLDEFSHEDLPAWLSRRLSPERLAAVCEKIQADDGRKALGAKLADNIPAALFFLLPLMAFVLKLFYPLSKRYYVEHLLFVVHYHAFFFLVLIIQQLFAKLGRMLWFPEWLIEVPLLAGTLYIPVYLYKAMRRVYSQGHLATVPKYVGMVIAYFAGLLAIFAVTVILAVFSI